MIEIGIKGLTSVEGKLGNNTDLKSQNKVTVTE